MKKYRDFIWPVVMLIFGVGTYYITKDPIVSILMPVIWGYLAFQWCELGIIKFNIIYTFITMVSLTIIDSITKEAHIPHEQRLIISMLVIGIAMLGPYSLDKNSVDGNA